MLADGGSLFLEDPENLSLDLQARLVRFLRTKYDNVQIVFIAHHTEAKEVTEEEFFTRGESGGTKASSAYQLALEMIDADYPPEAWNIYPFHFSDGDNWSMEDTLTCVEILKKDVLPRVNMFAYGQVESPYGSGQFIKDLREHFNTDERVVTSEIRDRDAIVSSIKDFLGKGK